MSDITPGTNERIRVLIVEDDSLQSEVLASLLMAENFDVDAVSGGLAAVWKVREGRYDVVLIDYHLPEIDGFAAARLMGDFMEGDARPVLIGLTATPGQLNARENGVKSAFDAVLAKSPDLAALFEAMARCLALAPERTIRQKAVFALLLKCWDDYDALPVRPGAEGDDPGRANILVIDDDEPQRFLLTSVLEAQGYAVETACDGLEAVRKIRAGCYDLALVDYGLPEMSGLAVGTLVRDAIGEDSRPRMIGLTANASLMTNREGIAHSVFDEIFQKSSDFSGLLSSMDRHMKASPNPATRRAATHADRVSSHI